MSQQMSNQANALGESIRLTRDAHTSFTNQVTQLDGQLDNIGRMWQGQGGVAFVTVKQSWNTAVIKLLSHLTEFAGLLQGTEKTFNVTDDEVRDAMNALAARLG